MAAGGRSQYEPLALRYAKQYGLRPDIFLALVTQESGWNPRARSHAGAMGLTQLMPGTARGLGVTNPWDPAQNLDAGARYLSQQLRTFGGDYQKATAAYNAGPGAVQKYGGVPPYAETRNYVRKILGSGGAMSTATTPAGELPAAPPPAAGGVDMRAVLPALLRARQQALRGEGFDRRALLARLAAGGRRADTAPATTQSPFDAGPGAVAGGAKLLSNDGGYGWAQDLGKRFGLRLASTYRSPGENARVGGSRTSAHMRRGAATDFAGTPAQMRALAEWAIRSGQFSEVFFDPVGQFDNGRFSRRGIGGHSDHVHLTRR